MRRTSMIVPDLLSRKKAISSHETELQALEARLKAAEERLKASVNNKSASSRGPSSPRQRIPLGDTFGPSEEAQPPASASGAAPSAPSRPGTAKRPASSRNPQSMPSYAAPPLPGALPPTPGASEGEYKNTYEALSTRSSADYIVIDQDGDSQPQQ